MKHFVTLDQLRRIDAQIDAISEVRQMAVTNGSIPDIYVDYVGVVVAALEAVYAEVLAQEI